MMMSVSVLMTTLSIGIRSVTPIGAVFVVSLCVLGCFGSTATLIVDQVVSPDGSHIAMLVDRYYDATRGSDEFFVIVVAGKEFASRAATMRHIGESAVLVATRAGKVRLRWQSDATLLVKCDACGLEAIDIQKKEDRSGTVSIIYQGFPEDAAGPSRSL